MSFWDSLEWFNKTLNDPIEGPKLRETSSPWILWYSASSLVDPDFGPARLG